MALLGEKSQMVLDMAKFVEQQSVSLSAQTRRFMRAGACLLPLMMGGCSSIPDSFNPVNWYNWAMETGDEESDTADAEDGVTDTAAAQPTNKSRPPADGLVGDSANAGYAAPIRRDVADTKPLVKKSPTDGATALAAASAVSTARPAEQPVVVAGAPVVMQPSGMLPTTSKDVLTSHYRMRLQESAARSISTPVAAMAGAGGASGATPVHLNPPKSAAASTSVSTGSTFLVASLAFQPDSAELSPSDRESLREVVRLYHKNGGYVRILGLGIGGGGEDQSVVVSGRASPVTTLGRADAVSRELTRMGIPASKILVGAVAPGTPPAADGAAARIYLDM